MNATDTRAREELQAELAAMTRLHGLSTRLGAETQLASLLDEVLDATMTLLSADFGNVQLCDPTTGALRIVAQRGFRQDFLEYFDSVGEGTGACGTALQRATRVIVEDVQTDPIFAPHVKIAVAAGFRAVQSTPLFSRNGEPLGMISTHFRQPHRPSERDLRFIDLYARQAADVIERKGIEESLRAAKAQVEMILDSITDQFFALSRDWRFTYLNRHAREQIRNLGMDPARLIGRVLWDVFPHAPNAAALRRVMTERVPVIDELFYAPLDEWVENHMYPSPDGGLVTFQRYITNRKRTEAALRTSEERFRRYFDLGLIGMAITTPAKDCVEVNDELCRILGYERRELLEKTWPEMTHPDDLAADVAQFNRVVAGEIDGYTLDKRWIRKDGRIVDTTMAAKCVRGADGAVDYFIGLVQDISDRKLAAQRLADSERQTHEARTQLQRRLMTAQEEERRRLSREMHDHFGQQLTALSLKLAALRNDHCADPVLSDQIESLEAIARQLDADVGSVVWSLRPTALDDLGLAVTLANFVNDWSKRFGIHAELHHSGVDKDRLPDDVETVLYRVLQEALTNVAKHGAAGNVAILLERRPDHVSLIVEDDGRGFDAEQAFGAAGKGLGLVGMRERITLVGGTLGIESRPGGGATLVVRIPVSNAASGA
jgi:PAS domain S-box-containing protein